MEKPLYNPFYDIRYFILSYYKQLFHVNNNKTLYSYTEKTMDKFYDIYGKTLKSAIIHQEIDEALVYDDNVNVRYIISDKNQTH